MLLLSDLLDDPVLRGGEVLCGSEHVATRKVDWFSVIEWPVEDFVKPNEVVMTTALGCDAARSVELVRQIVASGPAAIFVALAETGDISELPAAALAAGETAGVPIVLLPWRIRFADIARATVRLLRDPTPVGPPGSPHALASRYVEALLNDGGYDAIAAITEDRLDAPVVLLSGDFRVEGLGPRAGSELDDALTALRERIDGWTNAELIAARRLAEPSGDPVAAVERLGLPPGRIAMAVGASRTTRGFAYRCGPDDSEDAVRALEEAAYAAAVEGVRAQAVVEATVRAHGELFWTIARGDLTDEDEITRRARLAGYPHAARCVVAVGLPSRGSGAGNDEVTLDAVALPHLRRHGVHASRTEEGVLVVATEGATPPLAKLLRDAPGASWGIADLPVPIPQLRSAYVRARDTAAATVVMAPKGGVRHEHELGAYLMLVKLGKDEDTQRIVHEQLGPLLEYDQRTARDLTHTLAVYLASNCNSSSSARDLHLNRHSLLYRIKKIEALTGRDLANPDDRFLFSLALRLHRLERVAGHGAGARAGRPARGG